MDFNNQSWYRPILSYGHMDPGNIHMARTVEDSIVHKQGRNDDIRFCDVYSKSLDTVCEHFEC